MRKTICTLSLAALLSGGVITAQSTTQPRPGSSTPSANQETKLTGCLKEAPPLAGSASAGTSTNKFVLEVMAPHAGMPSENRSPEATRPQTPDQTTREGAKEKYALMAMGGVDFSKHVNHVVELTGTKANMPGTGSTSTPSPAGSTGTASTAGEHPMFHVTALRMVSTDCKQTSQ